jgi:hypothetical protein
LRSSGGVNPADPFLVHGDELPDLTDEQWAALTEIGKAGGGLGGDGLSPETRGKLLHLQVITPAGPGRVEITGIGIRLLARAATVGRVAMSNAAGVEPSQSIRGSQWSQES